MLLVFHQGFFHLVGEGIDFSPCFATQFDDEDGGGVTLHEEAVLLLFNIFLAEFQDVTIHQLNGGRMEFQSDKVAQKTLLQRIAMGANHHFLLGRQRVKVNFDFGNESQSALTSSQHFAEIDGAFFKWFGCIVKVFYDFVDGVAA